jgi:L-lactate dehydrogenase complex protein LldG
VTDARKIILGNVRRAIAERNLGGPATSQPKAYIRPQRAQGSPPELLVRFCEMARFAGASVETIIDNASVPAAVARFVSREKLGDRIILSPSDRILQMPWRATPRLSARQPPFTADDRVAVTDTVAGVAETGTLLVRSGSESPNLLHLLPEAHIAILDSGSIVGSYEDALALVEKQEDWPRAATFITGPSRTADIEKTPQIGVHGPRQLHIILIHGEET